MPEWTEVALIDWRDARTAVGSDVNLDTLGSSFTYNGVTWKTPSVARGNPLNQVASVVWKLVASGLYCESPDNSRLSASGQTAPHVYAFLSELGTGYGFAADPTRGYFWQCYASSLAGTTASPAQSGIGACMYKVDEGVALGNGMLTKCALGQSVPQNFCTSSKFGAPGTVVRSSTNDVLGIFYNGSGSYVDCYTGSLVAGDFPEPHEMEFLGSWRHTGGDSDNDLFCDPDRFRIAAFHNQEIFSPNAYVGNIQRSRLLQK